MNLKLTREGMYLYLIADGRKVLVSELGDEGGEIYHTVWTAIEPGWDCRPVLLSNMSRPVDEFTFEGRRLIPMFRIDADGNPHEVIEIPIDSHGAPIN